MDGDLPSMIGTRGSARTPFGIAHADRRQHLYAIGKTGSGKTTLLQNLIVQDILAGRGLALIDPHGDLADSILDQIPPSRADDVIYFNPADLEHPVAFNVLSRVEEDQRPLVAAETVATFKHLFRDSWGPRLEYILYNAVAALLDFPKDPGATLLGVPRMLLDDDYRARVVRHIRDPKVYSFWVDEFASYDTRFRTEAIAPIQNKVGMFLTTPALRNILGQPKSTIIPQDIINRNSIFLANLSKGTLGEAAANLLGSLLVTSFGFAAMARATLHEEERRDFHLVIDEFQNFTTNSFAGLLSEARKYRLSLTIAHQYLAQISPDTLAAVLGNVGTLISFRVGADDARALSGEFDPYPQTTLRELGRGEVCVRLLRGGEVSDAFLGETFAPIDVTFAKGTALITQSRQRHAKKRETVEEKITRWLRG